jgi:hypothetical protein
MDAARVYVDATSLPQGVAPAEDAAAVKPVPVSDSRLKLRNVRGFRGDN